MSKSDMRAMSKGSLSTPSLLQPHLTGARTFYPDCSTITSHHSSPAAAHEMILGAMKEKVHVFHLEVYQSETGE